MEDGLTAAYQNFTKFANDRLERLGVNISARKLLLLATYQLLYLIINQLNILVETEINDLRSNDDPDLIDLEKLTKMIDDMQQLLVNKSIAQSQAREIDQTGIRLERDVYTETLKYLSDINDHLPEVEELKESFSTFDVFNSRCPHYR